jgi:hypothetical protein
VTFVWLCTIEVFEVRGCARLDFHGLGHRLQDARFEVHATLFRFTRRRRFPRIYQSLFSAGNVVTPITRYTQNQTSSHVLRIKLYHLEGFWFFLEGRVLEGRAIIVYIVREREGIVGVLADRLETGPEPHPGVCGQVIKTERGFATVRAHLTDANLKSIEAVDGCSCIAWGSSPV